MLLHEILPDVDALGVIHPLEADGVVETAADGLVHHAGRSVRDPDSRNLHLIKNRVHHALLRGLPAHIKAKETEPARTAAQKLIGFVHDHQALTRLLLVVADLNAHHAGLGLHVLAVIIALLDFPRRATELLGKRPGKRGLPRSRCTVEEDIALSLACRDHLAEDLPVLLRELAVEIPRQDVLVLAPLVEATFNRLAVRAVHEIAERTAVEVPVVVQDVELAELALRRHHLRDLPVGAVKRHRVVERLLAILDTARP